MRKILMLVLALHISAKTTFSQENQTDSGLYYQPFPELLNTIVIEEIVSNNAATLEHKSSDNLDNILERSPNITMIKRGGYAFEPIVNGLRGGQATITIDGMRMFGACTDKMDPVTSYVTSNNLSEVEIGHGAGVTKYGSNLNAGLNLSTAKAQFSDSLKTQGVLNFGLGSAAREYNAGFNVNVGSRNWAVKLNGTKRKANSYRAGNGKQIDFTQYQKENIGTNLRFKAGKKTILEAKYIYDNAFDIGYAALPMDVSSAESNIAQLSAHFYALLPIVEKVTISGYANRINHVMDDTKRPPEMVTMHMDMPGSSETKGLFTNISLQPNEKNSIEFRADYYHNYLFAEMIMYPENAPSMYMVTWPGINRNSFGFFGAYTKNFARGIDFNASFRYDVTNTQLLDSTGMKQLQVFNWGDEIYFEHRPISGQVELGKKWSKKLSCTIGSGYAERVPTASEMYGYYLFNPLDGYDYVGTPDIKKERAWNVSSSSEYSNHKTRINVTGNYQYIQDFIYGVIESSLWQMTIDANGTKLYTNIEFAHLVSLNGNWTNQWTKKIRTNISATYLHGTKHNGLPLPQIAPLTSTINIEYLHNGWQFQLDVNSALAQNRIDTEFIELPSQGWAVTNVRLAKTVLLKKERKLSIQTGIENLFDNAYYQHLDWAKIQRPGINFYGAVNYSF